MLKYEPSFTIDERTSWLRSLCRSFVPTRQNQFLSIVTLQYGTDATDVSFCGSHILRFLRIEAFHRTSPCFASSSHQDLCPTESARSIM
jgi:hypothetical protein